MFSQVVTPPVKGLSSGKSLVDYTPDGKSHFTSKCQEGQVVSNECISPLRGCKCSGLHVSNNPLQRIPKGQPEIWCLFGTQIVRMLLDTGAYKSLIKPTVLERIQKDAILVQDDEIHTLCCANKMTNEMLGSVRLRFTISDETYDHWFLIFREQSCPAILGLDFLKENRMCI